MKKFFTFMAAALFTATASAQWVEVEDFDSENVNERVRLFNVNGTKYGHAPKGDFKIVADPTSSSSDRGNVVEVNCTDQETIVEVDVTLPEGTTLSDYSDIAFDLYYTTAVNRGEDDSQCYKRVYVIADDQNIYVDEDYFNILADKNIKKGAWGTFSTAIPENNVDRSFPLRLGILGDEQEPLTYYIDNIRLKEKEEPVAPGTTQNGKIVDGWLMLQDFEAATLNNDFRIWNRWGKELPDNYVVSLVDNPDGGKAAKITYPDEGKEYDTMFELDVTLTDGKLTDYSDIAFDLYRIEGDHVGALMYIDVNGVLIYLDPDTEEYPKFEEADGKWATLSYKLEPMQNGDEPAGNIDGITGSFKLHLVLKSPGPNYMIDNVRLKPATATGITDVQAGAETVVVVDGGVMINAGAKAAYAVYDISGRAVSQGVADGSKTVTLQRGVYVVRVNGKAVKVLVR